MPDEHPKDDVIDAEESLPEVKAETDEPEETNEPETIAEPEQHDDEPAKHITKKTKQGRIKRFWAVIWRCKKISLPLIVLAVLGVLLLVPPTRYPIFGLFWKQTYTIKVVDSQTKQPVTAATIILAGKQVTTNNQGQATAKVPVGHKSLVISKKYYTELSQKVLVPLRKPNVQIVSLQATGRQVPLVVTNLIDGTPLSNVTIKASGSEVRTDKNGKATIVLPADKTTVGATLSANGYNDAVATITIITQSLPANSFKLTPSGKVYFLSNLSGNIDVVKTNLDGTSRQTVVAGTGNEDQYTTSLLASRDWQFLALQAKRDTDPNNNSLYLIDTSTDKLSTIDTGSATFTSIGWFGHYFVYEVNRNGIQQWQSNATSIKSYNADSGQLTTIDSTQASGDQNNYAQENFAWVKQVGSELVYFETWYAYGYTWDPSRFAVPVYSQLNGKQAQLISAQPDGTKKVIKAFDLSQPNYGAYYGYTPISSYQAVLYEPNALYFARNDNSSSNNAATTYAKYEDGTFTDNDKEATAYFTSNQQTYPTYLVSPSGNQTFWGEPRDGKTSLFVGDQDANSPKQIASLSDYTPYGWYSDNYVLVEKNGSELYIMPVSGKGQQVKISDYYKPAQNFNGYGGGYGGL